jgi:hypothetical protein
MITRCLDQCHFGIEVSCLSVDLNILPCDYVFFFVVRGRHSILEDVSNKKQGFYIFSTVQTKEINRDKIK